MYLLTHPDVCVNAVGEKRGQETCESLLLKITPETVSNIQMLYVLEKKKNKTIFENSSRLLHSC